MTAISRRASIAGALWRADGGIVSGEALACELGISRVAVGKHIAALRSAGYEIAASPHTGYRLLSAPDACIPEEVAFRLGDPLWVACEGGHAIASTNDAAKELARCGAAEGTVVVAASQSAGRGRFGRTWASPNGGIYASFVLRPALAPAQLPPLSLAVALGAARGLEALGVAARLKWPNDIQLAGRKLGGMLLEMAAESERVEWVVAGIGINLEDPGEPNAAWLREVTHARAAEAAACALDGMAGAYREFVRAGFAGLRAEYEARLVTAGVGVVVRDLGGAVVASGTARGVGEDGSLLVESDAGTIAVRAGEVTLRD